MHVEFKSLWLSVLLIHSCLQGSACVTGLKALTISINFCVFVCAVTIISGIIMLILFVSELQYYLTKEVSSTCTTYRYPPPPPQPPGFHYGGWGPYQSLFPLVLLVEVTLFTTHTCTHTQINIYCVYICVCTQYMWSYPSLTSCCVVRCFLSDWSDMCVWTHTQSKWPKVLDLPYSVHDTDVTRLV